MSLTQHVSSQEGVDRDTDVLSVLQRGRRLSHSLNFDPLPPDFRKLPETLEPVGAYEVSASKRIAQVLVGVLSCATSSGVIFGFAALKTVLVREKVYRDLCTQNEIDEDVLICYAQDQRLNLTYVIAVATTNISAILVGFILDRYGPKICGYVSCIFMFFGSLCMAFAKDLPFDAYITASFLFAVGGIFGFVPSFHLSNTFPRYQGFLVTLITGAFDASAAVFLLFRILNSKTNGEFGLRKFFLIYLIVPVILIICQILIMPTSSYESRTELTAKYESTEDPMQDLHDSDEELPDDGTLWRVRSERALKRRESHQQLEALLGPPTKIQEREVKEEEARLNSGVWGALHGVPVGKQLRSPWFILITLLTILQMSRLNYFISTLWTQYAYMLESPELATEVNEFFDIALPVGGVATIPFIGLLLDNTSTSIVLALIVMLSTMIGVLGAVPSLTAAYSSIMLFCLFRPLYYSAMSDYAAKVFGFATFGMVYGTITALSGVVSFSQVGLQAIVYNVYEQDPGPVNLWLAGIGLLIGIVLVLYVDRAGRAVMLEHAEEDLERRSQIMSRTASRRSSFLAVRETPYGSLGATSGLSPASALQGERRPLLNSVSSRQGLRDLEPVREATAEV